MHDDQYKRLFAFPRLVEDLLRGFVGGDWLDDVDFSTLDKRSAEFVSDEGRARRCDTVWRVRRRGAWLYVLVMFEFESRDDPDVALRILECTALLYQELARNGALEPDGHRPPVLPVVLYNGTAPWRAPREVGELIAPAPPSLARYQPAQRYVVVDERRVRSDDAPEGNLMAAVAALEQSRSMEDLHRVATALERRGWAPGEERLDLVFAKWLERLMRRLAPRDAPPPAVSTVEEARMTLEERVSQWPRQWLEQGIEQGRAQGIEQGRALLCRLAARKFDAAAGEGLAAALTGGADPDRLAQVGDWIIECETGADLLARVRGDGRAGG